MLREINRFRPGTRNDLKLSRDLGAAAVHHSQEMAEKNFFKHNLKDGVSWQENIKRHGYRGSPIGENIAAGYESASKTFTQWKNSPGHRDNMLNTKFKVIGIGRAFDRSSKYGWYWTTTFGGHVDNTVKC